MQYQINISIDNAGLTAIYKAHQSVTLVKSVVSNPLNQGNLPIAWLTFQPFQQNSVIWQQEYNLYATTTALKAGATIKMTSITDPPAELGWIYTFSNAVFSGQQATGSTFNVTNQASTPANLNFGLAQVANVNGVPVNAPLNSVPILFNEAGSFTPVEQVSIFLSSYSNNGVVISQVAGDALTVTLSSQNSTANVGFDDSTNTFYLMARKPLDVPRETPRMGLEFARVGGPHQ